MIKLTEADRFINYMAALAQRDNICLMLFLLALTVFLIGYQVYQRHQRTAIYLGIGLFYATLLVLAVCVWGGLFTP